MVIMKISSFILLVSLDFVSHEMIDICYDCYKITKEMFVSFHDGKGRVMKYGLHHAYRKIKGSISLMFEDQGLYDIEKVVLSCNETESENPRINLKTIISSFYEPGSYICKEPLLSSCPKTFVCSGVVNYLMFTLPDNESVRLNNIEIYGYDININKFMGCFEKSKIETDLDTRHGVCEKTCSERPFYGFDKNCRCFCISKLSKTWNNVSFCEKCLRNSYYCGKKDYVSVYTHNPLAYPNCMNYFVPGGDCPSCQNGLRGHFCNYLDCRKSYCGNKACVDMFYERSKRDKAGFCFCREGYYMDEDLECYDVDECSEYDPCATSNLTCTNLPGNYTCHCEIGFQITDGMNCIDIDECMNDPCAIYNASCINVEGDYICKCGSAFNQISINNCSDIDECNVITTCDLETATCKNLFGDYECVCLEGYLKKDTGDLHSNCKVSSVSLDANMMYLIYAILLSIFVICTTFFLCYSKKK